MGGAAHHLSHGMLGAAPNVGDQRNIGTSEPRQMLRLLATCCRQIQEDGGDGPTLVHF